jgi:hypothetical protein
MVSRVTPNSRPASGGFEPVAVPAQGGDLLAGQAGRGELATQREDMHVEGLGRAGPVLVPDLGHQSLPGERLAGVADQDAEQVELLGPQRDLGAADGWFGSSYDWFGGGRAAQIAALLQREGLIRPMILVAPDATGGTVRDTECLDSTTGGPRIETFLTRIVVRAIDVRFRTMAGRADRAIGGLSAGGYCALNLGLRHQAQYGAILAMEPYGDPGGSAIRFMLGGNQALGRQNSPSDYLRTLPLRYRQAVFLGAASNDETRGDARLFSSILARRGDYVTVSTLTHYGHTWREGRAELPYALRFASTVLLPPRRPPTH